MPSSTGYDLIRELRADACTSRTPALALTAYDRAYDRVEDRERARAAGSMGTWASRSTRPGWSRPWRRWRAGRRGADPPQAVPGPRVEL